jgi:polyketide synthase PksN
VRNSGGKFFGPFEEYMVLFPDPALPAVDGTAYWREWAGAIDDFAVIDVDTETHAQVMTEPGALKKVLRLCDRLYAPGQTAEQTREHTAGRTPENAPGQAPEDAPVQAPVQASEQGGR